MACQATAFEVFGNIIGKSREELILLYMNRLVFTFKHEAKEKALLVECRWEAFGDNQKIGHVFVIHGKNLIHSAKFLQEDGTIDGFDKHVSEIPLRYMKKLDVIYKKGLFREGEVTIYQLLNNFWKKYNFAHLIPKWKNCLPHFRVVGFHTTRNT